MRRYVKMTNLHDIEPDANQAAYMYIYTDLYCKPVGIHIGLFGPI